MRTTFDESEVAALFEALSAGASLSKVEWDHGATGARITTLNRKCCDALEYIVGLSRDAVDTVRIATTEKDEEESGN